MTTEAVEQPQAEEKKQEVEVEAVGKCIFKINREIFKISRNVGTPKCQNCSDLSNMA